MKWTPQDLQTYQARRLLASQNALDGAGTSGEGVEMESELQSSIRQFCASNGWICLVGSMAHRTRRVRGEQDITLLADCGRVFFIECKSKTGKLRPEQLQMAAWANKLGHTIHVVRSMGDFFSVVGLKHDGPHHD